MMHLVSDRTVSHGVLLFPVERWPWATMTEAAAVRELNEAIATLEGERPHRDISRAKEILWWLAMKSPHAMVKHQAMAALGLGGTEPPSAA
jgi:hypothetical protein